MGPVGDLDPLPQAAEKHRMFSDNIPGAEGLDADFIRPAFPDDPFALIDGRLIQVQGAGLGQDLGQF